MYSCIPLCVADEQPDVINEDLQELMASNANGMVIPTVS